MHGILSFARFGINKADQISKDRSCGYFLEIEKSGNRLLSLVNNLLDLSKLEAQMMEYEILDYDINQVITQTIPNFKAILEEKGITLIVEKSENKYVAKFDKGKVIQVFNNLIGNALKYCYSGGSIKINFSDHIEAERSEENKKYLKVMITDRGIGIPEDELESIFTKFQQSTKSRHGAGGTGLGLAICKQIVSDHGGRIWAENRKKGGTKISFTLPLAET